MSIITFEPSALRIVFLPFVSVLHHTLQLSKVCSSTYCLFVGADNKPHFANPAAVQKAATVLGTTQEEITEIIFAPPVVNQFTIRMRRQSHSKSELSPSSSAEKTPEKQAKATAMQYIEALEGFAMGLYQEAFAALVRFINRYALEDEKYSGASIIRTCRDLGK